MSSKALQKHGGFHKALHTFAMFSKRFELLIAPQEDTTLFAVLSRFIDHKLVLKTNMLIKPDVHDVDVHYMYSHVREVFPC